MTSTETSNAPQGLSTDHSRATADGAHSHGIVGGAVQGSRADRVSSFDLNVIGVPSGREEEWRFSPVSRIAPLFAADLADTASVEVQAAPEVLVEQVTRDDSRLGKVGVPGDRTAVTAWNAFTKATVVTIPQEVVASAATHINVSGNANVAEAAHVVINAEKFSESVVVLDHRGDALLNESVEIIAQDGAHLTVVSVQDWNPGASVRWP